MMDFKEKIAALREYYSDKDSLDTLKEKEKELRTLIASTNLPKNSVVQDIIKTTQKIVEGIDFLLKEDNEMDEPTRRRLFTERSVHNFHLERLGGAEALKRMASIERFLDDKLAEIGSSAKEAGEPAG